MHQQRRSNGYKCFALGIALFVTLGIVFQYANVYPISAPSTSTSVVYIPVDLEDAVRELEKSLPLHKRLIIQFSPETSMTQYHVTTGLWIRNNWGLWKGSRLATYFNRLGIHHPDDMSAIILDALWYELHNRPFQLQEQVNKYQEYWRSRATPLGSSPKDGARIVWIIVKGQGQDTVHLGISVSDESYWRYEYGSSSGIEPARPEEALEIDELRETWEAVGTKLEDMLNED